MEKIVTCLSFPRVSSNQKHRLPLLITYETEYLKILKMSTEVVRILEQRNRGNAILTDKV